MNKIYNLAGFKWNAFINLGVKSAFTHSWSLRLNSIGDGGRLGDCQNRAGGKNPTTQTNQSL